MSSKIYVTQPSLPPLDDYVEYLKIIWETGVITHNGPLVRKLEYELSNYLNQKTIICVSNGTCALQLAIRALDLSGEIITTPFTYIATANIIAWENCKPVFVDIDSQTWNIDPNKIEEKITDQTSAILPVHVFSAPCDVDRIHIIASKNNLKVIYDAAHAFGVNIAGKSILQFGDISAVSFHATKLFNTAEGGACITDDDMLTERLRRMRFFGFDRKKNIVDCGMNAKMTEISAGLGLANLKYLNQVKQNRKRKYELYISILNDIPFITFQKYKTDEYNYSYMPVVFESEQILLKIQDILKANNIFARRYFYPSLNKLSIFHPQDLLPVSERISRRILCLPLYDTLPVEEIERICQFITEV